MDRSESASAWDNSRSRSRSSSSRDHKQRDRDRDGERERNRDSEDTSTDGGETEEGEGEEIEEEEEEEPSGEVSLREWLDRPSRDVDRLESLHVFRQVAEAVGLAHSQGVVVGNIRPSCFLLSAFSRVSFIESASGSGSGSDSCDDARAGPGPARNSSEEERGEKNVFPLKRVLGLEFGWYTSPEEVEGGPSTFASDVYRLGVLLFELFCTFDTFDQKIGMMSNLRHRVMPPQLLLKWPQEASFCLWLLHPVPENRPKMSEVLQSGFLNQSRNSLQERDAAVRLREEIDDQELLLEFLLQLQKQKQEAEDRLRKAISFLSSDIDEVLRKQSVLQESGSDDRSRKRVRPIFDLAHQNETVLSKSSRLMKNFKKLEAVYLSSRSQIVNKSGKEGTNEGSSVDNLTVKEGFCEKLEKEWMNPFLESLCKYLTFSRLKVRAEVKHGDLLSSSNLVCSLGFDRDRELFATAGVNKKIQIFECGVILNEERDIHYPVVEMCNRSKLSCVCWNSYMKSQIASSDFEGVVQVWDVTRGQVFAEMREHERRVWSVDFSLVDPTRLASGGDDGCVKIWHINQAGSVGTIRTKANVCSVQFQPDSARNIAIGSADHRVYCYDLRNLRIPYCTMMGHTKTVSYVKYMDPYTLVSASTDSTLKLWDLAKCQARVVDSPLQTFSGHLNTKNFVGLSISDGYIATGSETNEVFVYHKGFPMPVLSHKFSIVDPISGQEIEDPNQFISSVSWRGPSSTLLTANSSGSIKLLEMD
ncbi:Protein SPA1-RELATED 3 [Rhynchospora pubera]|uniref:Protein SPA1-RELATED 3 n=1 Tax=Rhynchospora pubera TaxID=906938 RepID=A0AAV8GMF8_9POAL|nr:Protein SPA1-RELATED 3 [Rhynchospora pubera]